MNAGEVDYAERKAMELFDKWNEVTGHWVPGESAYGEIRSIIIDAVHCGIQMAIHGKIKIKDGNVVRHD